MDRNGHKAKELPIPPGVFEDPKSRELFRAWIANEGLHISLNLGTWGKQEATGWGILLSDVARHIADALQRQDSIPVSDTLTEIQQVFDRELDRPTAPTKGGFVE